MSYFVPFDLPTGAQIPDRAVSSADCGAGAGGLVKNTAAVAAAIDRLAALGGGRVVIPAGKWLTGPIHLRSGIELHAQEGAEVVFSTDKEDYLPAVLTLYEGVRCYTYSAQIYAAHCRDVAVTGKGTFNGRGYVWWYMSVYREGTEDLYRAGEEDRPVEQRVYDTEEQGIRPGLLHFIDCENVTIADATFTFSPFWTVHPAWCRNIVIRDIRVLNPYVHAPNTDGCNLEGCRRGLVDGVYADTGDDAVCLKSGRDRDGRVVNRPCEDIVVRHVVANRSHGGVTIGSETSGGIRNVLVSDCEFLQNAIGIWVKTAHERGGVIENLEFHRIRVGRVYQYAVNITMGYYVDGREEGDIPTMPQVRRILIEDLSCEHAENGIQVDGAKGYPIRDVALKHITCRAENNLILRYAEGLSMENVAFR
jgi:polygalacturonase